MKFSNASAYRERSTPRTREDSTKAIQAFFNGVYDLANKHGIADVAFCAHCIVDTGEDSASVYAPCHIGNESLAPEMAAYLWSFMRADWSNRLDTVKSVAAKNAQKETA